MSSSPGRSPSEDQLQSGESCRGLDHLSDGKEDIGKKEFSVSSFLVHHPLKHPHESLIEALHQSICLRVVDSQVFDLQRTTMIHHLSRYKGHTLISENVLWDAHSLEQDTNDGLKVGGACAGGGALALGTPLAEGLDLSIPPGPEEPIQQVASP